MMDPFHLLQSISEMASMFLVTCLMNNITRIYILWSICWSLSFIQKFSPFAFTEINEIQDLLCHLMFFISSAWFQWLSFTVHSCLESTLACVASPRLLPGRWVSLGLCPETCFQNLFKLLISSIFLHVGIIFPYPAFCRY